jgi:undecaprenyl diphosphate synthase
MESSVQYQGKTRFHVAVIMDGNGRWATARGLPRAAGHAAGATALRELIEAAPSQGIAILTVYAFSVDNWRRPPAEVAALMEIFRRYLRNEVARLVEAGVRLTVIGRRDRLPRGIVSQIERAEAASAHCRALHLRVAIDYSGRDAILAAIAACAGGPVTREAMAAQLAQGGAVSDVDLVIRTSGEQRLSDFLPWEAAYAELYFTARLWPDFDAEDLALAMRDFRARDRRFGALAPRASVPLVA